MLKNNDFVVLNFKIIPNSKEFRLIGFDSWSKRVRLKIKNPAIKGKANKEIIEKLKKLFNADVEIIKGHLSNQKEIKINAKPELVKQKLEELVS